MKFRRREVLQAAIFLVCVITLAFADVAFLGRTLLTSNIPAGTLPSGSYGYNGPRVPFLPVLDAGASAWDYEPDVKVLRDDLAKGWLPLWDPYVGAGAPFLANMFSAALSPFRILLAAIDKPAFWDVYLLARLFFAALLTFLFARSIEIGFSGSLVAGIVFALSGHFVLEIAMPDLDVQILLPLLLLVADKHLRKPSYRIFVVTALLVALVILNGMPESAFFAFLLAGLYFVFRILTLPGQERSAKFSGSMPLVTFGGAGIVGLLVSLPLVMPFLEYLQYAFNPRAPGVGAFHIDANTAVSLIMPRFFGHMHQAWNGVSPFAMLPYVGAACFLLSLLALCQKEPLSRLVMFFAGFAVFYFLKAFGIPPVQWISGLPFFTMSIFPKHAFPELALCLAILAGMGAEAALKNEVDWSRFAIASVLISLIVTGFAAFYWTLALHAGAIRGLIRSCLIFFVNLSLLWMLAWAARRFGPRKLVALGLVLLPTAELIAFIPHQRTERYDAFTKPPFVDFLHSDQQKYRTFSTENFLFPNTNAAYGIDDIRSLDPLQVGRYIDFLRKDVSPKVYDRFDGSEPDAAFLHSSLLNLMNVKYVLSGTKMKTEDDPARFDLVYDHEVKIYRNNQVLPRAFLVHNAEIIPDKDRILARLTEADFHARQSVILEKNTSDHVASATARAGVSSAVIDNYQPNYVRIRTSSTEPGWLVLLDTYYPGWNVRIDGKEGRVLPADYIFRGVSLPKGSHQVEFIYRPSSFLLGATISASTLVTLLLLLLLLVLRGRSSHKQYETPMKEKNAL